MVTRQAKFVRHNAVVHSDNNCCLGTAISITYSDFVSVALVI